MQPWAICSIVPCIIPFSAAQRGAGRGKNHRPLVHIVAAEPGTSFVKEISSARYL